jgi:hypothetical protein
MLNIASGADYPSSEALPPALGESEATNLGNSVVALPRRQRQTDQDSLVNPWRNAKILTQPRQNTPILVEPAAPLSPMRDRDLTVMLSWFDREDMSELEKDVNHHLLLLFPEPYWEEDDWAFLQGYL